MSVLKKYFSKEINQCSPVQVDKVRKVNVDEDGIEHIVFEDVDYPKFQKSLGLVQDWSLQTLLKAGIDPAFPIHTGYGTRIEALNDIQSISADVDMFLANEENKINDNE